MFCLFFLGFFVCFFLLNFLNVVKLYGWIKFSCWCFVFVLFCFLWRTEPQWSFGNLKPADPQADSFAAVRITGAASLTRHVFGVLTTSTLILRLLVMRKASVLGT